MKKIILLFISLFLFTGCYDYQELSDINIVNGIAIDYQDGEYQVSFEIIKNEASDNTNEITSKIVSAKNSNLALAFNEASQASRKETYFKHVKLLVISEELAKKGIDDVIDYMLRDVKMSTTFFTVISKDPFELLKTDVDNETVSNYIVDLITSDLGTADLNNIDIIVSSILNKRKDIALPYIEVEDEEQIVIHEMAYFHEEKMKGTIDAKMYNFLYLDNTNLEFLHDDIVLNIYKKDIGFDISKEKVTIKVKGLGSVKAIRSATDLEKEKSYKFIKEEMSEEIKKEIEDFLEETLENDSDITGIKDKYYKKYKKEKEFVPYEVVVEIELAKNGAIYEAMHD